MINMKKPAPATITMPLQVQKSGKSLKNSKPNKTAQIMPEYSKGATKFDSASL